MFYDNLKLLCIEKGISMRRACLDIGLSDAASGRWAKGNEPSNATKKKFAEYFGVTVFELENGQKKATPIIESGLDAGALFLCANTT